MRVLFVIRPCGSGGAEDSDRRNSVTGRPCRNRVPGAGAGCGGRLPKDSGPPPRVLTALQDKVYRHLSIHFHRLAIEVVRLISPLADRFDCTWDQHGVAAEGLQTLDRAVLADDRL